MKVRLEIQVEEEDTDMNVNPYQKVISNASPKDENKIEQMINWSIFSNKIRYIDSCMNMTPRLIIRPLEEKKDRKLFSTLEVEENQIPDIIFDEDRVKECILINTMVFNQKYPKRQDLMKVQT